MKVYHGSSVAVNVPEIRRGRFSKDFGEGFYCATLLEQAKRWASRKKPSMVSVYEYLPSEGLKVLEFTEMTDEWLDFIVKCRSGIGHDYDIVIGAMANDQVFNYINDYIEGILTKEQFWVLAKFKRPTHQICFSTSKALESLTYMESFNLE